MLAFRRGSRAGRFRLTDIEDLKGDVIGHRTDEGRVERVVLDIVDNGRVVGVGPRGFEGLVALGVSCEIPAWLVSIQLGETLYFRNGSLPKSYGLVFATSDKVPLGMGTPAKTETLLRVTQ